jgi:gliding motility-associated-like protein
LGADDTICGTKTVVLKAKLKDSLSLAYTYEWYAGKDSITTQVSKDTLSVTPLSTTVYTVLVSNGRSCPGIDSVRLVKPALITLSNTSHVFTDDGKVELDFKVTNPSELPKNVVYIYRKASTIGATWQKIDSVASTDTVYKNQLTASEVGVFYYKVAVPGTNTCGTALESQAQRNIMIHATENEDLETSYIDWTTFIGWDSTVMEYQIWRSLDGGPLTYYNSGNLDTLADFINATDGREQCYRILAKEAGPNGHESWSNTVCIHYQNLLKAYNIFTPNGDGHNDVFFFKNLHFYPGAELFIFNRWGNKVFHQANYTNDWDGGDLPAGTYFYMLDLKDGSKAIQGDVLIHR